MHVACIKAPICKNITLIKTSACEFLSMEIIGIREQLFHKQNISVCINNMYSVPARGFTVSMTLQWMCSNLLLQCAP